MKFHISTCMILSENIFAARIYRKRVHAWLTLYWWRFRNYRHLDVIFYFYRAFFACRFAWWDAICANEKNAKRHVSSFALGYQYIRRSSRRVMPCTMLKLARRSRRLPVDISRSQSSLIAPSNSTATPINKYKRPPFADSIVSKDKSWAHTLAES